MHQRRRLCAKRMLPFNILRSINRSAKLRGHILHAGLPARHNGLPAGKLRLRRGTVQRELEKVIKIKNKYS